VSVRIAFVALASVLAATAPAPGWADSGAGSLVFLARSSVVAVARDAAGCPTPRPGVIEQAPGSGRTVALTFDDGPGPWTPKVLEVLVRYGVRATFFDTGAHDAQYPQYARAEVLAGGLIGNHTYDHRYPSEVAGGWTESYLRDQLTRTETVQQGLTHRVSCLFRAPGGHTSAALPGVARSLGLTMIGWSVDTEDWRQPDHPSEAAVGRIVAAATDSPGQHPVVLMHAAKASHEPDSLVSAYRGNTVRALPAVIEWYRSHGYRFVTMEP
jgi:peptidoglycan/xylan/chitin deacetylase (PgdA/CDA1 family)